MSLANLLIILSFLSLILGAYAIYRERKSAKKNWGFLLLACCASLWNFGGALYFSMYSVRISTVGIYLIEVCILFVFPIITYYFIKILDLNSLLAKCILVVQILLALVLVFYIYANSLL
ncbi:hypothetical protein K7I13_04540 [Brucepastera parasyntrophica]|uniref:hypothetical protein n=1 Tax=Brucepastera parasyntrophica TaxID=2880008 RepID=UPI00210D8F62|nr:hypothetical protein [Brucepastera parasyntrophica]ULQ60563.1 hypothetical protein K7I13_04540 [Brucepastera parasyntrophica]